MTPKRPQPWEKDPSLRCTAHSSRTGDRCKAVVIPGGTVCRTHGGSTPQVRRAAQRRIAKAEIERNWTTIFRGEAVGEVDPVQRLLEEIAWSAAYIDYLRWEIAALGMTEATWGVTRRTVKAASPTPGVDLVQEARPAVLLELHDQERDRLARLIQLSVKLGIEAQQREAAARLAGDLFAAVGAALSAVGLDGATSAAVRAAIAEALRSAGGAS